MVPKHLQFSFVTPERALAEEEVDEVELPGEVGYVGVLPGHAPLLLALRPGEMWYRRGARRTYAFVGAGFAEVLPDRVSVLAQVAERAEDIDAERAEAAKRRAEERLARPAVPDIDAERARIALMRALIRLQVSGRHYRPRP
jgi:F-type H+-transporting ATPase subunit epsilon